MRRGYVGIVCARLRARLERDWEYHRLYEHDERGH